MKCWKKKFQELKQQNCARDSDFTEMESTWNEEKTELQRELQEKGQEVDTMQLGMATFARSKRMWAEEKQAMEGELSKQLMKVSRLTAEYKKIHDALELARETKPRQQQTTRHPLIWEKQVKELKNGDLMRLRSPAAARSDQMDTSQPPMIWKRTEALERALRERERTETLTFETSSTIIESQLTTARQSIDAIRETMGENPNVAQTDQVFTPGPVLKDAGTLQKLQRMCDLLNSLPNVKR